VRNIEHTVETSEVCWPFLDRRIINLSRACVFLLLCRKVIFVKLI